MHWKNKGRFAGFGILAAAFVNANAPMFASPAIASDPVVQYLAKQPSLQDAEIAARDQFDGFLRHITGSASRQAAVKVAYLATDQSVRLIWLTNIEHNGTSLEGQIADTGAIVAFSADQVRDWSFIGEDGKLYGSYSTRAMLPHLPRSQADQIATVLSPTPTSW